MIDQAEHLRSLVHAARVNGRATRVAAVTSGKGGVGKSNFTLNLALGLAAQGKKVVIIDADVGFANIEVLMGVSPKFNLQDLIAKRANIWEILEDGPSGIQWIAGGSGLTEILSLNQEDLVYFISQLSQLQGYADFVLIDTGAGMNTQTLQLILSADDLLVVTTPEPTSITDAYALIKLVANRGVGGRIQLVINRVMSQKEGIETAQKLQLVSSRFLNLDLAVLGFLPDDQHVSKAVRSQQPFFLYYPDSAASRSIAQLTAKLMENNSSVRTMQAVGIKSFLSRMINFFGKN